MVFVLDKGKSDVVLGKQGILIIDMLIVYI